MVSVIGSTITAHIGELKGSNAMGYSFVNGITVMAYDCSNMCIIMVYRYTCQFLIYTIYMKSEPP